MAEDVSERINSLYYSIDMWTSEKRDAEEQIQKALDMQSKVNQAISEISNAKGYSNSAISTLEYNFKGVRSRMTKQTIENITARFSAISANLSGVILVNISENIGRLQRRINALEWQISRAYQRISELSSRTTQ